MTTSTTRGRLPVRCATLVLLAAGLSTVVCARESVRLAYRFEAGTECFYDYSGTVSQNIDAGGTNLARTVRTEGQWRRIVVEVSRRRGEALIGQLAKGSLSVAPGEDGASATDHPRVRASVYRMDRRGRCEQPAARSGSGPRHEAVLAVASQLADSTPFCPPFPEKALRVGDTWTGTLLVPLPDRGVQAQGTATLVEVRPGDGSPLAVVQTVIVPVTRISGTASGTFDVRRGLWVEGSWDVRADLGDRVEGAGFENLIIAANHSRLSSVRTMSPAERTSWTSRITLLDRAIGDLYGEDVETVIEQVRGLSESETHRDWHLALESALVALDPLQQLAAPEAAIPAPVDGGRALADRLMSVGDRAALDGRWQEAASAYEVLAQRCPEHRLVPLALREAADLYQSRLANPGRAAELRRRILELSDEAASDLDSLDPAPQPQPEPLPADPDELYRLAQEQAEAGETDKAIGYYDRLLAIDAGRVPVRMRLAVRFQRAALYERQGRVAEAWLAYDRLSKLDPGDEYTARLKTEAAARADNLLRRRSP